MRTADMTILRKAAMMALFTLALASCNGSETAEGEPPVGDPIAHVAPPAGQSWQGVAAETPEGGVVVGNPDAALKLVEYASHTCPHCADFSAEAAAPLLEKYVESGVVSYEIRNVIRDPLDLTISLLARCGGPELFHPLAEAAWGDLGTIIQAVQANSAEVNAAISGTSPDRLSVIADKSGLYDFFSARGVSREQAQTCLMDQANTTQVALKSDEQANEDGVNATPTFFLNGRRLEDVGRWSVLEPVLQNAGAR